MNFILLFILEDVNINLIFFFFSVLDKDMGENNLLKIYVLEFLSDIFGLLLGRKIDEILEVNLVLIQKFDREKLCFYRVYLVVKDGGFF